MQSRDKDALDRHILGCYGEGLVECPDCGDEFEESEEKCWKCGYELIQPDPDAEYDGVREAGLFIDTREPTYIQSLFDGGV